MKKYGNQKHQQQSSGKRRLIHRTLAASAFTLALSGAALPAAADHGKNQHATAWGDHRGHNVTVAPYRDVVRVRIPLREHGSETLRLKRLIRQETRLDPNDYRLKAVVVKNGPFSNGYATLKTGDRKSSRYFLPGYERTRIPAPSRARDSWRLRLGPGTQVSSITAVLEPRRHARHNYRDRDYYHHVNPRRDHYSSKRQFDNPLVGLAWLIAEAEENKAAKRQKRALKQTRAELARTEAELERTRGRLDSSRERNKKLKHQRERLTAELAREQAEDAALAARRAERQAERRTAELKAERRAKRQAEQLRVARELERLASR
ncbi:MAG: hypothetical protein AAGE43_08590 [Pseudomonadota bacterium]